MSTLMEQTSEKETKQLHNNHNDEEIEIDLMDLLRKVIGIRKKIYKAAGIGLIIGVIVAISIPNQYTVEVTLSPEMGNNKGGGLSGLAASFLGSGVSMCDCTYALNASLSADIVSSTPFLLELSAMEIPVTKNEVMTLNSYL
ncbi:MAG: Wzz/FepE/Etk N-terminal domain-containing protein, partial [Bacteroides xylanisolvens]